MKHNITSFPEWMGKEHPDFGFDVPALITYMQNTEQAKRAFKSELLMRLRRYEKRMKEGNRSDAILYPALLICDILGIESEAEIGEKP